MIIIAFLNKGCTMFTHNYYGHVGAFELGRVWEVNALKFQKYTILAAV